MKLISKDFFLGGSGKQGTKQTTYTIESAAKFLDEVDYSNIKILHVGINDLKSNPVDSVLPNYMELVNKAKLKADRLLISTMIPTRGTFLNNKLSEMNEKIHSKFSNEEGVLICYNDNLSHMGQAIDRFYYNATKLSDEGIRILASNIRKALFPRQSQNRLRGRNTENNRDYRNIGYRSDQYRDEPFKDDIQRYDYKMKGINHRNNAYRNERVVK